MVTNHKPTGRAASMPLGLFWGSMVSIGVTVFAAALLAKMVDAEKLEWENIGYGITVLLLGASFLGALVSYHKVKRQRMLVCMASGLIYFGILLSITALFFGGQYDGIWVTAALVFGGSAAAALLGLGHSGGKAHRKIRIRNR